MVKSSGSSSPIRRPGDGIKRNSLSELATPGAISSNVARSFHALSVERSPLPVASDRRNNDFHRTFKGIGEQDRLIEDYSCALQKEILVQGRMYISASHVCFNSKILGFHTNLVINIADIRSIEKKATAMIFHNAIVITTRNRRYTFASLVSRDNTFNLILELWQRVPRIECSGSDRESVDSASLSFSEDEPDNFHSNKSSNTSDDSPVSSTECACLDSHYPKIAVDRIISYPLACVSDELISNSEFITGFISSENNSGPWSHASPQTREISYTKPLNIGPIGPKQTRVITTETVDHFDIGDYVSLLATSSTPDVPSGSSFCTKARTCLTHAQNSSTRILITITVEWSKTSFLKGPIEKSALDGVSGYSKSLVEKLINHLEENQKCKKSTSQHDLASPIEQMPQVMLGDTNASHLAKRRSERRLRNWDFWSFQIGPYYYDSLLDLTKSLCTIQGFVCLLLIIVIIRLSSLESAIRELAVTFPQTPSSSFEEWITGRLEKPLIQSLASLRDKKLPP